VNQIFPGYTQRSTRHIDAHDVKRNIAAVGLCVEFVMKEKRDAAGASAQIEHTKSRRGTNLIILQGLHKM
jgi:hypothetical protein